MTLSIRLLSNSDLESADAILGSAFHNPDSRAADLGLYRQIEPEGLWMAFRDGQPVGMIGAVNYAAFAYAGFLAIHETFQRQGIGLALMQHLLRQVERQGVPLVLLDASDAGRPMYVKLGFTDYDATAIFRCEHVPLGAYRCPPQVSPVAEGDLAELAAWERGVFGADRGRVLRTLWAAFPGRAFMVRAEDGQIAGYVLAQANRIGPWVAGDALVAEWLLQAALSVPFAGAAAVAAPRLNPPAAELLRRYPFAQVRTNWHMGKGASQPPSQRRQIYGQTSLFFG
jgi:predicted N-acetyltransferase YhbS